MANYIATDTDLEAVADAIRDKGGTSADLEFPHGFVDAIDAIQTGGGASEAEAGLISGELSGDYENSTAAKIRAQAFTGCTKLTSVSLPNATEAGANAFYNCSRVAWLRLPALRSASANYTFSGMTSLTSIVLPSFSIGFGTFAFSADTNLSAADIGNGTSISGQCFSNTKLSTLVLRKSNGVFPLAHINAFTNTPFASGGTGGTLYVPSAMIASYQSATNWSTILGYETNQILPIEGSIYETQYADGTPITT